MLRHFEKKGERWCNLKSTGRGRAVAGKARGVLGHAFNTIQFVSYSKPNQDTGRGRTVVGKGAASCRPLPS